MKKHIESQQEIRWPQTEESRPNHVKKIRLEWLNATEIFLQLGVKSDTARRVLKGRLIAGPVKAPLPISQAQIQSPFLDTPLAIILGDHWVEETNILSTEEGEEVYLPPKIRRRLNGKKGPQTVCPRDLERKTLIKGLKIHYHPIIQRALVVYMTVNQTLCKALASDEIHWISSNEVTHRLRELTPPISIDRKKLSKLLKTWYEDLDMMIPIQKRGRVTEQKSAQEIIGFRQKPSGGVPGWWIDLKAFEFIKQHLTQMDNFTYFMDKEQRKLYKSVRQISAHHHSETFSKSYLYIHGLSIAQHLFTRLQTHPTGFTIRFYFGGVHRRLTLQPKSIHCARGLGPSALYLNAQAQRVLLRLLDSGVTCEDIKDCKSNSLTKR